MAIDDVHWLTATQSQVALFPQSMAAAHLGQVEEARRPASDGLRLAMKNDDLFYANSTRAVLGFLKLSLSNFPQALGAISSLSSPTSSAWEPPSPGSSPASVESALTQIYRKLEVRSRTEPARKIANST